MKKINWKNGLTVALAVLVLFPAWVQAQDQGLGDMMFTAGTVKTLASGNEWAWLQWMATDSALLKDRPMDIYFKAGDPSSANPFTLKGRSMQVTDPRAIALLLKRGEALGENLTRLEGAINSLYAGAAPAASLSLAEKLAALVSGSQTDPELYNNLVFIGRAHPAVSMVIGQGFACKIPSSGFSTFEVRDHRTSEVIGRVTLEAGAPTVLPAPGPLLRVLEESPMGHLNVRLRWDIPTGLKRVSLLQFGYNLYRVPKAYAENPARRFDLNPPAPSALPGLLAGGHVVKVNRMPIVVDAATVTADTYFVVDDNNWEAGSSRFVDGAQYYYFVSALDLLGRDGLLSDGLLASPYDRMAPGVPHGLKTRAVSHYNKVTKVRDQWVELSWEHNTNDTDVAAYYVYRHDSIADMQSNAVYAVSNRISGAITPVPGATRIKYEDHTLGSNEWTRTYWYTVRSADNSAGGANLSGNSAPAFAVLRNWAGPTPSTNATINIRSERLYCEFLHTDEFGELGELKLTCLRPDPGSPVRWAEFAYYTRMETNIVTVGRYYFSGTNTSVSVVKMLNPKLQYSILCRVGSASGTVSEYAHYDENMFNGEIVFGSNSSVLLTPVSPDFHLHFWGKYPNFHLPEIIIPGVERAKTARVYRRVDGGPRTLVYQGEMPADLDSLSVTNYAGGGSVNGGTVCYYYQLFDEHGNASPMVKIRCFQVEPRVDLPTPILDPVDPTGLATNKPGMELTWFCTTPGVQRFEVALAIDEGDIPSTFGVQGYPLHGARTNAISVVINGTTNTLNFGFYQTGRAGVTFGTPGSPKFALENQIDLNRDYTMMVRAIGVTGKEGEWSNAQTFRWSSVPTVGPQVPWPAREMPVIQTSLFHRELRAEVLNTNAYCRFGGVGSVGIRIGEIPLETVLSKQGVESQIQLTTAENPMDFLYHNLLLPDQTAMPFVLYRYQVPNNALRSVSGDVVQVTPLMENIAYGTNDVTIIYDPYFAVARPSTRDRWGLYVMDTQPVIRFATYQYLLVRFNEETKEIDRVIPAGIVTIL